MSFPYKISVFKVEEGCELFAILDELNKEFVQNFEKTGKPSGFYCNRCYIADAFKEGRLYSAEAVEEGDMYKRGAASEAWFIDPGRGGRLYQLPCFCVIDTEEPRARGAVMLWCHKRVRRMGIASTLVRKLGVRRACPPLLEGSEPFWSAVLKETD